VDYGVSPASLDVLLRTPPDTAADNPLGHPPESSGPPRQSQAQDKGHEIKLGLTGSSDSSNYFTPMLRYKLHFANMAYCFHLSRVQCAPFPHVVGFLGVGQNGSGFRTAARKYL
jgi:hypothetical protein